ncbi:MAG TPA: cAMP-activated global transcriptional regulator CRP [Nocardioides sp.]|nr:cAMP-activated global transcriptional regulator CRP [Xanthomonadales bacterium]MDZ3824436.1 cAMP-activated global transcriptional regulator CRP [Pseudoxanthomonas sp.]HRI99031.1 cAMP-activated global transcriptional regulator CRP [Nocardioides sp.]
MTAQLPASLAPDRASIERFLSLCHRRRYPAKAVIMRPGDPANTLFFVVEGSLSIIAEDEEGREIILAYVNPGDFIGELGLFVETPRRAVMIRTRTACDLAEISYERLFQLLDGTLRDDCPKILFKIGSQIADRLLATSRKVSRLAYMDVTNRVAQTLVDLCSEPDAQPHPQGKQIRISRQEMSRIVGCSREMVGRVLKQLEEQGVITVTGKTIVVLGFGTEAGPKVMHHRLGSNAA